MWDFGNNSEVPISYFIEIFLYILSEESVVRIKFVTAFFSYLPFLKIL